MRKWNDSDSPKTKRRILRGKGLILSIVALVEIILILVISTYAWVETVSTIRIYTGSNGTTAKNGEIISKNSQKASIAPSSGSAINLSQMIHEAGDIHMAPASSSDGKNIIFPAANGQTAKYRLANSSDNMVNYVSFSFKVAQATSFVFNQEPQIKFDGDSIGESSLVRISLAVGSGTPKIFAIKSEANQTVINGVDEDGTPTTGTTNVNAFSSFLGGNDKLALQTTEEDQIVTVKIWIQDPTFDSTSTYQGKMLTISALKLVPAYSVTSYVSVNNSRATSSNQYANIAKVQTGSSTTSYVSTAYYKYGATASLKYILSDSTNYVFCGWGIAENSTSYSSTNNPYPLSNVTENNTYYAIFRQKITITAKAVLNTGTTASATYGTVQVGTETSGATSSSTVNYNGSITLKATAKSGYTFVGWYKTNNSGTAENTNATYTPTSLTSDTVYYARFMKNPTITAYAVLDTGTTASDTYGTVQVGSATSGGTSSSTVAYNGSITLTAAPKSGYTFVGWYKTNNSGTAVSTNTSYTPTDLTSNTLFYARFMSETWEIGHGTSGASDWTYTAMTVSGNTVTGSLTLTEGQDFSFKIRKTSGSTSTYYGANNASYSDIISTSFITNLTLSTSGGDVYMKGHAGTYTFTFNKSTNVLNVTASYSNITITFDTSSTTWVANGSAIVWFDTAQGSKKMTKEVNSSNWTASVPSNYATSIYFKRNDQNNTTTWHTWNAGSRNYSTTYKSTGGSNEWDSNTSGNWQ